MEAALKDYAAAEEMFPENTEMKFWHAVSLLNKGMLIEAKALFKKVFEKDHNWEVLLPRLVKAGLITDENRIKEILR